MIEPKYVFDDFRDWLYNIHLSPYSKTIYVDTDVHFVGDISELFLLLDEFDIAVAPEHRNRTGGVEISGVPHSFPQINAGVILFRNTDEIKSLFENAIQICEKQIDGEYNIGLEHNCSPGLLHDQYSFTEAPYHSNLRMTILSKEYNFRGFMTYANNEVKILHSRNDLLRSNSEEMNSHAGPRVFISGRKEIYFSDGTSKNLVSPV